MAIEMNKDPYGGQKMKHSMFDDSVPGHVRDAIFQWLDETVHLAERKRAMDKRVQMGEQEKWEHNTLKYHKSNAHQSALDLKQHMDRLRSMDVVAVNKLAEGHCISSRIELKSVYNQILNEAMKEKEFLNHWCSTLRFVNDWAVRKEKSNIRIFELHTWLQESHLRNEYHDARIQLLEYFMHRQDDRFPNLLEDMMNSPNAARGDAKAFWEDLQDDFRGRFEARKRKGIQ